MPNGAPSPTSMITTENSPVLQNRAIKDYSTIYAFIVAIIVFAAVATTDLLLRLKRKQKN
jgi:hypothetical protein